MAKKKQKLPNFVMIRKDLLKDKEWRKLSSSSKVLYIYLRGKFNHYTLSDVTLAYSEINDMMSSRTISRSFKELLDKKFIIRIKQGGLFGGVTTYKFTGEYKDYIYQGVRC